MRRGVCRVYTEPEQREWYCPSGLGGGALAGADDRERHEGRAGAVWSDGGHVPPLDDFRPLWPARLRAYHPPTDAGYDAAWVSVQLYRQPPPAAGTGGRAQVHADLSALKGRKVVAVRYAWGSQTVGAPVQLCCDERDARVGLSLPCEAGRCPIVSTRGLPANPFLARIVHGRCKCVPPQTCDDDRVRQNL